MNKTILILLLLFGIGAATISSCSTGRIVAEQHILKDTVTVIVTETLRDTLIQVLPDSSLVQMLIECDSLGQARLKQIIGYESGERVKPPDIDITDNVLTATAKVDSLSIYHTYKDKLKEVQKERTETKIIVKEVNKQTRWQRWMCGLGHCALGAIVIGIILIIFYLKFRRR